MTYRTEHDSMYTCPLVVISSGRNHNIVMFGISEMLYGVTD